MTAKVNVNMKFEGELAEYLIEIAKMQNKSVQKVLEDLVREELEEDKELSEIADQRYVSGAKVIKHENVDWSVQD